MYNGCNYVLQAVARLAGSRAIRAEGRRGRLKELEAQQQVRENVSSGRQCVELLCSHIICCKKAL